MSLEDVALKVIPPLVVLLIATVAGVVINVYIIDSKLEANSRTNQKQWEFISDNTQKSIRNEEKIKCIEKVCK